MIFKGMLIGCRVSVRDGVETIIAAAIEVLKVHQSFHMEHNAIYAVFV